MAVETFQTLKDMTHSMLYDLVRIRHCSSFQIITDIKIVCRCRKFVQQKTVRKNSGLGQRFCGTAFQISLE